MTKRELTRMTALSVFFISGLLILLGVFGKYVLIDMTDDILAAGNVNKALILGNSTAIENQSEITGVVLENMHKHTSSMFEDHSHDEGDGK